MTVTHRGKGQGVSKRDREEGGCREGVQSCSSGKIGYVREGGGEEM